MSISKRKQEADALPKETRFHHIIPPDVASQFRVMIVGCGAIGSWLGVLLGKMGINKFELWDADKVARVNVGVQIFGEEEVGEYKVMALGRRIYASHSPTAVLADDMLRIRLQQRRFTKSSNISPLNDIVVAAVDNVEARLEIYAKLRYNPFDKPRLYIDGRMGATTWEMWCGEWGGGVRCLNMGKYEASLAALEGLPPAKCGEQSTPYNGPILAGKIASQIRNWIMGDAIVHYMTEDVRYFGQMKGQVSAPIAPLPQMVAEAPQPTT